MKIGTLEIKRAPLAAAEPKPRAPKEIGTSGTLNCGGYLQQEEYNSDLTGTKGIDTYERMRSADGAVAETLGHIFAPIKNAEWPIESAGTEPLELEQAALAEAALFDWLDQPWLEVIDQVLDYPVFGHAVFETPYKIVERELSYEIPNEYDVDSQGRRVPRTVIIPPRQYATIERFAPRLPKTITKWNAPSGRLESIEQSAFRDDRSYEVVTIPAEQLLVFTNQKRGDDFTGRSILRAAYKHWWFKELLEKIGVLAALRHGVGVWIAYPPASAKGDSEVTDRLEEIFKSLGAEEKTPYIISPGPKALAAQTGLDGWTFEIVTPEGTIPDFEPLLQYHRGEIKGSVLVRFSELGHGQTGARATSDTQAEVWKDALHAVARYICEVFNVAIERLIDLNYSGVERYPKLKVANIEASNLTEFADAHYKLVQCKAIEPDDSYRQAVRKFVDMPPPDEKQEDEEPPEAPPENVLPEPEAGVPVEDEED